jgi:hypothetical protein
MVQDLNGPRNKMVDDASQCWDVSDTKLLAYFITYPQPESWQLLYLKRNQSSVLTLHLLQLK